MKISVTVEPGRREVTYSLFPGVKVTVIHDLSPADDGAGIQQTTENAYRILRTLTARLDAEHQEPLVEDDGLRIIRRDYANLVVLDCGDGTDEVVDSAPTDPETGVCVLPDEQLLARARQKLRQDTTTSIVDRRDELNKTAPSLWGREKEKEK